MMACKFAISLLKASAFVKFYSKSRLHKKGYCGQCFLLIVLHLASLVLFLLLVEDKDFADVCATYAYAVLTLDSFCKLWHENNSSEDYISMCKYLTKIYTSIEKKYKISENLRSEKVETKLHKLAMLMYYYSCLISLTVVVFVMFLEERFDKVTGQRAIRLPIFAWYPFDIAYSPNYELAFMFQILAVYLVQLGINGHLVLGTSLLYHCRHAFIILQYLLKNTKHQPEDKGCILNIQNHYNDDNKYVPDDEADHTTWQEDGETCLKCQIHADPRECIFDKKKSEDKMDMRLRDCIIYHVQIIEYFKKVNGYIKFLLLCDMILAIFLLVTGTVAGLELQSAQVIPVFGIMSWAVLYIFVFCWFSSDIQIQSESVATAAYMSDWENGSDNYKKCLIVLITCAQKRCSLQVGSLYPANLDLYVSVMQAAYSNFTFLRSMAN